MGKERFASMDVGGEGQDKTVMFIWDGFHIENVYMKAIPYET